MKEDLDRDMAVELAAVVALEGLDAEVPNLRRRRKLLGRLATHTAKMAKCSVAGQGLYGRRMANIDAGTSSVGPRTPADLSAWPAALCSEILSQPDQDSIQFRLASFFGSGLILHSNFSGQLCAERGIRMSVRALEKRGVAGVAESALLCWSANDNNKTCCDIIARFQHRPYCLFNDVFYHLPLKLREKFRQMMPPRYDSRPQNTAEKMRRLDEASEANARFAEELVQHMPDCFPLDRKAPCSLTGASSFMMFPRLRDVNQEDQPVTWEFSGPMCTPHTAMGDRKGDADPSMPSWLVWSGAMACSDHDMITCENSHLMPANMFQDRLALGPGGPQKWMVVSLILDG